MLWDERIIHLQLNLYLKVTFGKNKKQSFKTIEILTCQEMGDL